MATGILDNIKEAVQASLNVSQMKTLTNPITVDSTEYSTVETALNAINSKSVDVDDELSTVSENPIQNKVITEEVNTKLTVVDTMPTAAAELVGKQRLYVGSSTGGLNKGGIYECQSDGNSGYEWVLISTADVDLSQYKKTFVGTRAEWNLLSAAEKKEYDICNLTDDVAGGELIVSDAVTDGDLNPVTSNAVAVALGDKFIPQYEQTENTSMASMAYGCIDTNLPISKVGYTLVSACAYVEYSDAILCSVYPYSSGKFRVTYFNTAANPQTVPVNVKLLWMKN